jgi:hypothetical protein
LKYDANQLQLEQALGVSEKDVKDASAGVLQDLKRFQKDKEADLRRYMVCSPWKQLCAELTKSGRVRAVPSRLGAQKPGDMDGSQRRSGQNRCSVVAFNPDSEHGRWWIDLFLNMLRAIMYPRLWSRHQIIYDMSTVSLFDDVSHDVPQTELKDESPVADKSPLIANFRDDEARRLFNVDPWMFDSSIFSTALLNMFQPNCKHSINSGSTAFASRLDRQGDIPALAGAISAAGAGTEDH